MAVASATPAASSDAWPIVSSMPIAWPAAAKARTVAAPGDDAEQERLDERPRPPGDREPAPQLAGQLADLRPARRDGGDPLGAGQPVGRDPERQDDDQQPGHGHAHEHRAGDDAPDAQDEDRDRGDRDDDGTMSTTRSTTTVPSAVVR